MGKVLRMIRSGRFPGFEEWFFFPARDYLLAVLKKSCGVPCLQSLASHFTVARVQADHRRGQGRRRGELSPICRRTFRTPLPISNNTDD
jgi:hypothetical protein